jgi:hypothetical protein
MEAIAVIGQAEARDTINKVCIAIAALESIESRRLRAEQNRRLRKATDTLANVVSGLDPDFLAVIRVGDQPIRARMRPSTIRSFFDWLKPGTTVPPHTDLPIVGALSVRPYELSRNPFTEHHFVETIYGNNEFFVEIPDLRDSIKYGSQLLILRAAELAPPEAIQPAPQTSPVLS